MTSIPNKTLCSGCSACAMRCPKHCITMQPDSEGFLYPSINETDCIGCRLCERICHELHPYEERKPLNVYAAFNKDEGIRMNSSSGGIFYLLAEKTISEGGVVFGARFDNEWQVELGYSETMEDVIPFMGSKYVQARTGAIYKEAEAFLKQGRKVLFSASPCQIAGLLHYLRKEYENLTTIDFVCHGAPSPKVWQRYLDEVATSGKKAINDIKFRNKSDGWKRFNFILSYEAENNSYSLCSCHQQNHYMRAFLSNLILRPSCHNCQAKQGRSHSDITIADFWGINNEMPEMDDDKGTSLVLVNTERGCQALDWSKVTSKESSIEAASKYNAGLSSLTQPHPRRSEFFINLDTAECIAELINKSLRPTFRRRIRITLGRYKKRIKERLEILMMGFNKEELTPLQTHQNSQTEQLSSISPKAAVSGITFRNKQIGWKTYRMEIRIGR